MERMKVRLTAKPLLDYLKPLVAAKGGSNKFWKNKGFHIERNGETMERLYYRLPYQKTIDAYVADKMCIAVGIHPVLIWPEEWMQTETYCTCCHIWFTDINTCRRTKNGKHSTKRSA